MALNLEKPRHESKLGRPRSPRDIRRRRVAVGMREQGGNPDVHKWVQNPDVGSYIDEVKLQESRAKREEERNPVDFITTFSANTKEFERAITRTGEFMSRAAEAHAEWQKNLQAFSVKPTDTPFWTSVTSGTTGDSIEIVTSSSTLPEHE